VAHQTEQLALARFWIELRGRAGRVRNAEKLEHERRGGGELCIQAN